MTRALRLGVAGPVGTGKSSLIALLCAELGRELSLAVITNDIYTDEDARFLRAAGVLAADRTTDGVDGVDGVGVAAGSLHPAASMINTATPRPGPAG